MPRFRFSSTPDSQIDPFNAGDPVMPGDEPEWLAEEGAEDEVSYAPHGEKDGVPHKPEDNYQAPVTRSRDYDAPSTDETGAAPSAAGTPSRGQQWQRAADAAKRRGAAQVGRTATNWAVIIFVVFVLLGMFGDVLVSCALLVEGAVSSGIDAVLVP